MTLRLHEYVKIHEYLNIRNKSYLFNIIGIWCTYHSKLRFIPLRNVGQLIINLNYHRKVEQLPLQQHQRGLKVFDISKKCNPD